MPVEPDRTYSASWSQACLWHSWAGREHHWRPLAFLLLFPALAPLGLSVDTKAAVCGRMDPEKAPEKDLENDPHRSWNGLRILRKRILGPKFLSVVWRRKCGKTKGSLVGGKGLEGARAGSPWPGCKDSVAGVLLPVLLRQTQWRDFPLTYRHGICVASQIKGAVLKIIPPTPTPMNNIILYILFCNSPIFTYSAVRFFHITLHFLFWLPLSILWV